jgi:hypothetical protein
LPVSPSCCRTARSRYVYAYYPDLDSYSHHYGTDSRQAQQTLAAFDALFGDLLRQLRGSNTWVLVTADHGFIDSPPRRVISLDDHPQLAALLLRPLCGERRVAYCYVARRIGQLSKPMSAAISPARRTSTPATG